MKQDNKNQNNTNIFNYIPKKYSSYVFDATTKYQKKYGFDMGTGEHQKHFCITKILELQENISIPSQVY